MPHILLRSFHLKIMKSIVLKGGSDGKASVCSTGDPGLIPGLGRSPRGGNGYSLQHSCLENPLDRGACRAAVHEEVPRVGRDLATKPPPPSGMEREGALTSLLHHT